ncbi:MAG: alanine racemase [Actinomycetota bacterium]
MSSTTLAALSTAPTTPSTVTVSSTAIADNARLLRALSGVPVMAVVKADGFGLGAARVARAALAGGASELGVATCDEALALRAAGITAPILAWLLHDGARVREALEQRVRLSVTSATQLEEIARIAAVLGVVAEVELEVETGMHRSGAAREDWPAFFAAAREQELEHRVRVVGVWTHLAGTAAEHFTAPLEALAEAVEMARGMSLRPRRHAAASVAAVTDPRTRLDLVRLGASLFGIEPVPDRPVGLRAVAVWESHVTQVRDAEAGGLVGYGRDRIGRRTRLALIPLGYADGLSRRASPGLDVAIAGRRFPFVGTISMDQAVIDIGDADVSAGDRAVLVGDADSGARSLREWADALGTIPQEVLTGLGARVARIEEGQA